MASQYHAKSCVRSMKFAMISCNYNLAANRYSSEVNYFNVSLKIRHCSCQLNSSEPDISTAATHFSVTSTVSVDV